MNSRERIRALIAGQPADCSGLWFGPRLIGSPSHEALLPKVPLARLGAMAQAEME